MNLYTKYRPKSFDEIVGHQTAKKMMLNSFTKKTTNYFLLSGDSGVGKTTMALAACNEMQITDVMVMNTANNRGIDTAREIIEELKFKLLEPRAYIIEEAHQTTKDFQDSLLVALEDWQNKGIPVYFFFCTTEVSKIRKPLAKRLMNIKLTKLTDNQIIKVVENVSAGEGITLEDDVLDEIVEYSGGSARDAIQLFESVVSSGTDNADKQIEIVRGSDLSEESAEVREICKLILDGNNWGKLSSVLKTVTSDGVEGARHAILAYLSAVLLNSKGNNKKVIEEKMSYFVEPFYDSKKPGFVLACACCCE